jgi:hypothetical protein
MTPSGTNHTIQLICHNRGFAGEAVTRAERFASVTDREVVAAARAVLETFHIGLPCLLTCTATDDEGICGLPATKRVTITGADQVKSPSASELRRPTPWNLDTAPRCDACAKTDYGVVSHLYPPGWTYNEERID